MAAENDYHDGVCQKCGVYQNLKAFRRKNGCRIRVCRRCDLMQCIACTAKFSQICFTATEISNYFTKATPVVCLQCKQRGCTPRIPHPVFHGCCGPCARVLGREEYTSKDWSKKKKDGTYRIVCSSCQKALMQAGAGKNATKRHTSGSQELHPFQMHLPQRLQLHDPLKKRARSKY